MSVAIKQRQTVLESSIYVENNWGYGLGKPLSTSNQF